MTDRAEIEALIERVEEGTLDGHTPHCDLPVMHLLGAYAGSLDAAEHLHNQALPDFKWSIDDDGQPGERWFSVGVWRSGSAPACNALGAGDIASRAWLLAILRALLAEAAP